MVNVSLPNLPILVAEDDPVFRGLLGSVLESSGHPVEMVVDGQAALERVKQTPGGYALVITDIQMPRLNGLELARALQSTPDPVPMIAMTGFGDMDLVVQLLRLGVQDFLEKPFSFDDMTRRVAAVLRRRKERPSAPGPGNSSTKARPCAWTAIRRRSVDSWNACATTSTRFPPKATG